MSIQDKFERNTNGLLQLTDKAAIEVWQTSTSIEEANRKEWAMFRQLAIYEASVDPSYLIEFKKEVKVDLATLATAAIEPDKIDKWRLNRTRRRIQKYAGPNRDGECHDGFIDWIRATCLDVSGAPLKSKITRLRKKGVSNLKMLKRAPTGPGKTYYAELNVFALRMAS